jgi:hypothetical protein
MTARTARTRSTPSRQQPRRASARAPRRSRQFNVPLRLWLLGGLVLLTLSTALGVVLPFSPAGLLVHDALGDGAILAPLWLGWLTWLIATGRQAPSRQTWSLGVLSTMWLILLAVRDDPAGGGVGAAIRDLFDDAFGRSAGMVLVWAAALGAALGLVGFTRIAHVLLLLGLLGRRLATRTNVPRARFPAPDAPRLPSSPGEPVILGPRLELGW